MSDLGALGAGWLLVLIRMGWNPHIAVIWMWNLSSLPMDLLDDEALSVTASQHNNCL